jgi:hypothetical protein
MSSVIAYNAQGQQVKNYSTLYNGMNISNPYANQYANPNPTANPKDYSNKYANIKNKPDLSKMPTGISSSQPQTYPSNDRINKPQPLLNKQLEDRYKQIHSEPKPSSYEAYAGNTQSTYASFN